MKKLKGLIYFLVIFFAIILAIILAYSQADNPESPPSQPPEAPESPSNGIPPPPGPPGQPMFYAAYFNCTPINYGDNITIIVQATNINKVNVTVYSNTTESYIEKYNVDVVNGIAIINILVEEYNTTLLPCIQDCEKHCNESNNCYVYFNVSYSYDNNVIWRLNDEPNLTIWESGASCVGVVPSLPQPLPTPHIITPTRFCKDYQTDVCCNETGDQSYYYNASKAIWHNATVENLVSGWNWTWTGKSPFVLENLTNTSDDFNKINLTHVYGYKNVTNLFITLSLSNGTKTTADNVIIPLSNCEKYQPIVTITHPEKTTYSHVELWHNATVIDPDTTEFNFTWNIIFKPWKGKVFISYANKTILNKDSPNTIFKMNYTGNYTSLLSVTDGIYGSSDTVTFEVINATCNCTDGTPCGAWNPSRTQPSTFCNLSGKFENFCLVKENCPNGYFCNITSRKCQLGIGIECPTDTDAAVGCSWYSSEANCSSDPCGLGKYDAYVGSSIVIYTGCLWNGTSCVQGSVTINQQTGSVESCTETIVVSCPEAGGQGTITHTFSSETCCSSKYDGCSENKYVESITCPQPISFAMPGWSGINIVAVVLLLAAYYVAYVYVTKRQKTKKQK